MRHLSRIFDTMTKGFLVRYTHNPMKLFGIPALIMIVVGCAILACFGIQWAITRELHVRPLLLFGGGCVIMGIQFFSLGLLGEMIIYLRRQSNVVQNKETK